MQAIHRKYDINYVKNALDVMQLTAIYYHQRVRERDREKDKNYGLHNRS